MERLRLGAAVIGGDAINAGNYSKALNRKRDERVRFPRRLFTSFPRL